MNYKAAVTIIFALIMSAKAAASVECEIITVPKNDYLKNDVIYLPFIKFYVEKSTTHNEQECLELGKAKLDLVLEFGHKVKKVKVNMTDGKTKTQAVLKNI
jgi:hypothetical protein